MFDDHSFTSLATTYHHHGILVSGQNLICNDSQIDNCVKECARQFAPMDQQACVAAVEARWAPYSNCFNGNSTVIVKGKSQPVCMKDLSDGDLVLDSSLGYTRIVGWLHRDEHLESQFLMVHHQYGGNPLIVTDDHLLYCATKRGYVASKLVDSVETVFMDGTFIKSRITERGYINLKGVYAPLTQSGTLIVNGVHASCYASPKQFSFPVTQWMGNFVLWPFVKFSFISGNLDSYLMSGYFNLEKSFAFYGAYHSNSVNQIIHVICVPLIFTTSMELLSRLGNAVMIQLILVFYIISFIKMHVKAGLLYAPFLMAMYYIGTRVLPHYPKTSLIVFCLAWIAQFIGHGFFEKRAPALLTNLPQGLHAAVFFVWLEFLFFFGFDPILKRKLKALVARAR